MSRAYLALLIVSGLSAQTPASVFDKAPPDVDQALRDRIARFYQAHVDKKFRQAEAFVAEETKDLFYSANKPACLSFRIDTIAYSENFTRAKAVVMCKQRVMVPGFEGAPMELPTPDTWKLENGQWYWYVDLKAGRDTPFGHQKPAAEAPSEGALPASIPSVETLLKSVQADKNQVHLIATKVSSDQVMIASKMLGPVTLRLEGYAPPGLRVNLDRTELKPGEQAKVAFTFTPRENSAAGKTEVGVRIQPLNHLIVIEVNIQ